MGVDQALDIYSGLGEALTGEPHLKGWTQQLEASGGPSKTDGIESQTYCAQNV
jgi:hypothetical protein